MHRQIGPQGLSLIKRWEGFSPTIYLCPANVRTIGYGHAIRKGEKWDDMLTTITEQEAEELLRQDVYIAETAVSRLIYVPLSSGQFDSLCSFSFNLGSGALQRSTLRQRLNRYEYLDAGEEFPKWCYAGGRKLKGLLRRRLEEQAMYFGGVLYER